MSIEYSDGAKCILKHCYNLTIPSQQHRISGCKRRFVRAVLLSPHTSGITKVFGHTNGPVKDFIQCSNEVGNCGCLHAEVRTLQDLIGSVHSPVFQYILLVSYSPCTQCANAIVHSGMIDAVIYDKVYDTDPDGEERLKACGIPVLTVKEIEDISIGKHRGELCFVKRWS